MKTAHIVLGLLLPVSALAQSTERELMIVARGVGEVSGAPTRAIVTVGIETRGDTVSRVAAANAARMATLHAALVAAGVPASQITTMGYTVHTNERMMYVPRDVRVMDSSRYIARNTLRVEVRDVSAVGRVLEAAANAGATNLSAGQFTTDASDDLRQQALAAAVTDARRSAETMARAAGGTLGRLLEVSNLPGLAYAPMPSVDYVQATGMAERPMIAPRPVISRIEVVTRWQLVLPPR